MPPIQNKYVQGSKAYADLYRFAFRLPASDIFLSDWYAYHAVSWGPSVDSVVYTADPNYIPSDYFYAAGDIIMEDWIKYWDPHGRLVTKSEADALGLSNLTSFQPYDKYSLFQQGLNLKNSFNLSAGNDYSTYYFSASTRTG